MLHMWHMMLMLISSVHLFKTFNKLDSKNQRSNVPFTPSNDKGKYH